ncbi:transcriptional regulator [Rhodopirellula maiorica SM1]|uniref:Transcriptional regulator n=1 Tax=Rhodopirellula maiorica SM1 TaxID=1265738 RepID=M5RB11_9BACT|nr:SIR2 family protein [Rhodopirellula maiorica]EMI16673.1 transcriptional regulator [Rhodopirellula maiorica SM1]
MSNEIRHAKPGRIRSLLAEHKLPVMLIGAGASISSGIPAAGDTVERAAKWAWCKDNGRLFNDPTVRPSDYKPWLAEKQWFDPNVHLADLYPLAIDNLLGIKRDRRDFFEKLISPPVDPNRGYRSLAKILHQGWVHTVLTTNFDDCVQRAATLEGRPHYIAKIKTRDDLVMFSGAPAEPQLIYIHGSVEHYTDKNLSGEVLSLAPEIVERIRPLLRDHPLVVVGYRGAERSVMNDLFHEQIEFTNQFAQGVFWCTRDKESEVQLSPLVRELADKIGSNFNSVTIRGFDDLFEIDLWNKLSIGKTPPAKHRTTEHQVPLSFDMQPIQSGAADNLDFILMKTRLKQYAETLNFWIAKDENWFLDAGDRLHLLAPVGEDHVPTYGGLLLFGTEPNATVECAEINVALRGPKNWLRKCLGDDIDSDEIEDSGSIEVTKQIAGNLWSQLDELTDFLSLVNFSFRLKAEHSKQVQAYNSIALKEAIVNALVHRDYKRGESIEIVVTPTSITIKSPGGLIDDVNAETGGMSIEELIKGDRRGIKGYRNPVISDLFYGGGQMDRRGSGLADLWQATVNNNGDASFGPDEENKNFIVTLQARPEVVDEVTNTALPATQETIRFAANALVFHELPKTVWCASTTVRSMRSLRQKRGGDNLPGGHVHDYTFYTFFDLDHLSSSTSLPFKRNSVITLSIDELLAIPNGRVLFVKLMNELLFEHLRQIGLRVDYRRRRAHYPKPENSNERKISYKGRVRKATRTVVKARSKRDSKDIIYFEHKAVAVQVMDFNDDWAVVLSPGYTFTRDGVGWPIGRERINVLSTRRAAKDFNQAVHQDVTFWIAMLSGESGGVFALRCREDLEPAAPTVVLSNRPPTVSFGSEMFAGANGGDLEDSEFTDLEEEIAQLAESEEMSDSHDVDGEEIE